MDQSVISRQLLPFGNNCLINRILRSSRYNGLIRCAECGVLALKQEALPASLETLFVTLPCSQTPGGPPRQTIAVPRCCPRYSYNEGSLKTLYAEVH